MGARIASPVSTVLPLSVSDELPCVVLVVHFGIELAVPLPRMVPVPTLAGAHAAPVQVRTWPAVGATSATGRVCRPTTTVAFCGPVTSPARLPLKLVAVVAVAALPEMLMLYVPLD